MFTIGHNGSINHVDGVSVLHPDPRYWGPLVPKAEYLSQFGPIKAWEIYILPHQLRPLAIEQLAQAVTILSKHRLFAELEWLSFHFPTDPQSHHLTGEISQEQWRPFRDLLKVLNHFEGAKERNLNFHVLAEASLASVWQMERNNQLELRLQEHQAIAKEMLDKAYTERDAINPTIGLTVENNPPYHNKAHRFHLAGLFPAELKTWQLSGVNLCLDIQHASLVHWYRQRYGYDGPIPCLNQMHHQSDLASYAQLIPRYLHSCGVPDTPESLHRGVAIGIEEDDVDWSLWAETVAPLRQQPTLTPIIVELEEGHIPAHWPACQTSAMTLVRTMGL